MLLGFEASLAAMVELARQAEAGGFASVYTAEATRTALVPAAAIASATERLRVGTYVVNAYGRDPWLTGLAARDLDELSGGRFVLGIGTGNRHFNQWYMGVDTVRPVAKLRDFVTIVRAVIAARAGDAVHHVGDVHRIRWRATYEPVRPGVPVYLAASGTRMVALAGEVADGVGVGIMTSSRFLTDIVRPNARAAALAAGRDPDALAFPMAAQVSVNEDEELAREATRRAICGLFHPVPHPYYDSQLRQLGFADFADEVAGLMPAGRTREAMARVPDEVIDTMTVTGTPQQCAGRLRQYEASADEVIVVRIAQRGEPTGVAAYEPLWQLAAELPAAKPS
jgi:alkanesulfonate monooxygenase SsuD/methylene tetrahydromethanopterin reductase-like flavin-dependent oxidoreductase (luciferase family)